MSDEGLLVEVLMALGKKEFVEQVLVDMRKKYRDNLTVFGAVEGKRIYINPLHHKRRDEVVSTLVHEGVHAARPEWKERSVERAEKRLSRQLSQDQADAIFRVYKATVRRFKGVHEV
jgi:hypothetical protein